jgi:transcriptional regulator with XRE-family HTH domain
MPDDDDKNIENNKIEYKKSNRAQNVSRVLNSLLEHNKLSFRGLSKVIGITQPHLSRLSKGEHSSPGIEVLDIISNFFGISISQLIGDQKIDFKTLPKVNLNNLNAFSKLTSKENKTINADEKPSASIQYNKKPSSENQTSPTIANEEPSLEEQKSPSLSA